VTGGSTSFLICQMAERISSVSFPERFRKMEQANRQAEGKPGHCESRRPVDEGWDFRVVSHQCRGHDSHLTALTAGDPAVLEGGPLRNEHSTPTAAGREHSPLVLTRGGDRIRLSLGGWARASWAGGGQQAAIRGGVRPWEAKRCAYPAPSGPGPSCRKSRKTRVTGRAPCPAAWDPRVGWALIARRTLTPASAHLLPPEAENPGFLSEACWPRCPLPFPLHDCDCEQY
jgi:hypothetical protein